MNTSSASLPDLGKIDVLLLPAFLDFKLLGSLNPKPSHCIQQTSPLLPSKPVPPSERATRVTAPGAPTEVEPHRRGQLPEVHALGRQRPAPRRSGDLPPSIGLDAVRFLFCLSRGRGRASRDEVQATTFWPRIM